MADVHLYINSDSNIAISNINEIQIKLIVLFLLIQNQTHIRYNQHHTKYVK